MEPDAQSKDREFVRWCLSGAPGAWDDLARVHAPAIGTAVRRTLVRFGAPVHPAEVDDLVQETLAQLMEKQGGALRQYQGECPLSQYLQAIAAHRTIDWLRRERRHALLATDGKGNPAWLLRLREEFPGVQDPSRLVAIREQVAQAMDRLPDRERLALKAFYWDGLPTAAIGTLMGLTQNTVTVLLSRARKELRNLMKTMLLL